MTMSQELALPSNKDVDAISPIEYSGDYRSQPLHYSVDQYGRHYQVPQHRIPATYREAPTLHYYPQPMSCDNMILQSPLYNNGNYQASPHIGQHCANYAPSNAIQLAPIMIDPQMNPANSWQGDWQAASAHVSQSYTTPMTIRQHEAPQNVSVQLMEQNQTRVQIDGNVTMPVQVQLPLSSDGTVKTEAVSFVATNNTAVASMNEASILPSPVSHLTPKSNQDEEVIEATGLVGAHESPRESTEEANLSIDTTASHSVPAHSPQLHRHEAQSPVANLQYAAMYANRAPKEISGNAVFSLGSDSMTNEIGWYIQYQSSPFQSSPCLNSKTAFAIRPLGPGILAGIHNEWLNEFPEPVEEVIRDNASSSSVGKGLKRFPTPYGTFESQHVRSLWQELEKRRILQINHDPVQIQRVRNEAFAMLQKEALQRRIGIKMKPGTKNREEVLVEITEEDIDERALILWEQSKKSSSYAVGLLRQAEYCIAQGHLGFVPLQQSQMTPLAHKVSTKSATSKKEEKKPSKKRSHKEVKQEEGTSQEVPLKRRGRSKAN